jgi:ATP-binding cassette subfamily F protein 3
VRGHDIVILQHLKLMIAPGERIGLLGPNGAGKSTLVRTLARELPPLSGTATFSPHLRVGYFAQHQLEQLDPKASPVLHLKRLDPRATEQDLRTFLGGFNFRGDRVFEAVEPFSGGEKARLALALVVYQRPNLLLLDEPTNHLDLDMRHALETALLGYAGAVVLVSHDRHLISATCDSLLLVADGGCKAFAGDDRALRAKVEKRDAQLNKLHVQLTAVDGRLADPALYASGRSPEAAQLEREQRDLRARVAKAEEEWLAAADLLEAKDKAGT